MSQTTHEIIAFNVQRLMKISGDLSQMELAKKTGISQRTISNVLKPGSIGSVTIGTIEKIAQYFKIEPYHLLIPNLPVDELQTNRLESVIQNYALSSTDSRKNILRIAENESKYSKLNEE